MKRDMMQWVDEMLAAERKKGLPVLSFPAIQRMGVTVKELIASSDLQARAMKLVADVTPGAASLSMMDLSLEAEAFGSKIRFSSNEVPTVIGAIIEDEDDADALEIPAIGTGRTQIYIDAIEKAVKLIDDRPVFAGTIGPFSLAGRLMGVADAMVYCLEEPDMVHTVLDKVTRFLIDYILAYRGVGANGVVMAEPLAGILSPELEEEFSHEYVKRIVAAAQTDEFLVCYHNCGNNTLRQTESIAKTGCRIVHFGNAIDMGEMVGRIPEDILVMGNVDPASQFRNGTPESVKAATLDLMRRCASHRNFVPSSGCDIPPQSPWENIMAFFEGIDAYYEGQEG